MKSHPAILIFAFVVSVFSVSAQTNLVWTDIRDFEIEGKGWTDTKNFFDRLPVHAEKKVRPPVWELSQDSAGICVRFVTDAPTISAQWILRKERLEMPHMPSSGVSGLDIYVRENDGWRWAGAARPGGVTNQAVLVKAMSPTQREYLLYLPLYNGVKSVKIGVPASAKISTAPGRKAKKPILFYGTSILQGGCASRPGLAYPAIIGRKLDWPVINLGFSGNAKSEPELAELLAELDPALYVLDPLPNMDAEMVRQRIPDFVKTLRAKHTKTPIILVESLSYTDSHVDSQRRERYTTANAALREVYNKLKADRVENLHLISGKNLVGHDSEGTVDGVHPNDIGFMRMAEEISPALRKLLK